MIAIVLCLLTLPSALFSQRLLLSNTLQADIPEILHQQDLVTSKKLITNSSTTSSIDEPIILSQLSPHNQSLIEAASTLIINNFKYRAEYQSLPSQVIELYKVANSSANLYSTLQKPLTYAFTLTTAQGKLLGIIITQRQVALDGSSQLQIKRLHISLAATGYKGIGTCLIKFCYIWAKVHNITTLMTTASLPARSFFEHLGWKGQLIETVYKLDTQEVKLTQFKCFYHIN